MKHPNVLPYQILVSTIHGKIWKCPTKTINLKYQLQRGMMNSSDWMDHILYGWMADNPAIKKYKIWSRIEFKIKSKYYLELQISETMKLVGGSENNITQGRNGENVPHLQISEFISSFQSR